MSDISTETLEHIHSFRGEMYAFLAQMFCNVPRDETYTMMNEMAEKLQTIKSTTNNAKLIAGIDGLEKFVDNRNKLENNDLVKHDLKISQDYTTLYCLTKSVPMDESIYTSPDHHERQDSWDEMKLLFRRYKFSKIDKISENEDYISYELLFMSMLAYRSADLVKSNEAEIYDVYIKEQKDFHVNHFNKWIPEFVTRTELSKVKDEELYKYIANIMLGFIEEDVVTLQDIEKLA